MLFRIFEARTSLESLTVYRGLLQDAVIGALNLVFQDLTDENTTFSQFINHYSDFCHKLLEKNPESAFTDYLIERVIFLDNAFGRHSEKVNFKEIGSSMKKAVERDLASLTVVASIAAKDIKEAALERFGDSRFESDIIKNLPEWESGAGCSGEGSNDQGRKIASLFKSCSNWAECIRPLADFHKQNGSGEFALYKGFVWEHSGQGGCLKGILSTDPVRFSDLIGYEAERKEVVDNTLQFLNGFPANNVLLYGDRGTGKSSTVKALLNEYGHLGLRIIELPKAHLDDLHQIIRLIKDRQQKFIIFIDDLAFADSEEDYTALKAILEGSLESKPGNAVIYATSNRRHLIKEKFSDRSGLSSSNLDDEVRAADTLQEKLSLADRFGITVTFTSPDQDKYLKIVEGLAAKRNLDIDTAALRKEALKWELYYNGRSPRTARQFVDWLEGTLSRGSI